MKIAFKQSFFRLMAIVSVAVFVLGALPCTAQADTYSLAELIADNDLNEIQAGTLTFSSFKLETVRFVGGALAADPAGIFIETLDVDSPQPGLKIKANNQLVVKGASVSFQETRLSYEVVDANNSIQGVSLLLVPGCAESGKEFFVKVDIENTIPLISVIRHVSSTGVEEQLLAEKNFDAKESLSISNMITIFANPNTMFELGQASLCAFEQRFKLAPTRADAGPDQVVQDSVMLDGSGSEGNGLTYEWKLIPRDPSLQDITPEPSMNPILEVKELGKSLYDVTLTVTDENGLLDTDTMLLAAAGACEDQGGSLPPAIGKLDLWNFKIKKYKFCNWAFARVYGTVDASDLPLDSSKDEDGLKAKVILQVVDKAGNTVGEWSAETAAEIKDRKYKYVIRKKH